MLVQDLLIWYLRELAEEGRSVRSITSQLQGIIAELGARDADSLETADLSRYRKWRRDQKSCRGSPYSQATINRELTYLRAALRRARVEGLVSDVPHIPMRPENGVRYDYCTRDQLEAILGYLRAQTRLHVIADVVEFLFWVGWRKREALDLRWVEVSRSERLIRLPPERTKTKIARTLPLVGAALRVIERRWQAASGPWVFHRRGQRIVDFRRAWDSATRAAGCLGLHVHGFRRGFARHQMLAGVPQPITMALAGWRTDSIYRRYAIVDEVSMASALRKTEEFLEKP
jgi:integrase